jgi:ketosteroid isomerase-like protein
VVERIFIALIQGELEAVLELIHPEAEWTPTLWSGEQTYKGREGVAEWLAQFGSGLEHLDHRIERMQTEGDRAVVQGTVFDSRDRGMFAVRIAWSFELEDGMMRRGRAHDSWGEALLAVGLTEGANR